MKLLKRIAFCLLGILLFVLTIATILEKVNGTEFVNNHIYSSVPFIILWGSTALASLLYMIKRKLYRQWTTFLLHLSFILILVGAFVTWIDGEQGTLQLKLGEKTMSFINKGGEKRTLPFSISLEDFEIIYYKGTRAPMDYVSRITVSAENNSESLEGEISMNKIFSFMNYRFYQSGYDANGQETVLSVSHDPYGIGITYTGYSILLVSIILFFLNPQSTFRQLMKSYRNNSQDIKKGCSILFLLFISTFPMGSRAMAADHPLPKTLPRETAGRFGDLYILYNDRICPLQTFARDFTIKLYGKPTYHGLTSEQVLTGWLFYYDSWKNEPVIRIKSNEARRLLDIKGQYASVKDFAGSTNEYKLEDAMRQIHLGRQITDRKGIEEANEKFNIISMVCTGALMKIFPYRDAKGNTLQWYAQSDRLPNEMGNEQWTFTRKAMNYVHEQIVMKRFDEVNRLLNKIKQYQQKECGEALPSASRFKAEKLYNQFDYSKPIAIFCLCIGLFAFIYYCRCTVTEKNICCSLAFIFNLLLCSIFIYLSMTIVLRGYVSNHLPLSNGFETMQFMAWCTVLLTFFLQRKFTLSVPFGFLLCGLTLLVSMFGEQNPRITQLIPVLQSPLLSIHVVAIMTAYSLLAFIMLNGITAVVLHYSTENCETAIDFLQRISRLILYPAVFLLTIGIFIGAVWANVSWGRYWGWDPKEVWALITMLVYALALHPASLKWFRYPMFFHVFGIVAFLTVLITYFGVNFLLGGMHSYANG
ncbi:cytochrome c biogenesis protein CcsA [Phocaeicola massiliensis]|jgi:cytochrome c-type biogenesis protein CcsB|uniref:cytochrome c biogenesis protein CcsA n=1 Tax=Phocaeicola massiliensis TaxID=204516 RepID=UPI001C395733|nr:cytochrome c biogenesis protein CcsA [Phocaeicola massiliensis]MBV3496719.1 cytochrome c biogenesis protein CcsA [Phocaeicola massiliensis]